MSRNNSVAPVFEVAADGWCSGVLRVASPNCDARPADTTIDLLVIHNISLPPNQFGGKFIEDLFTNRLDYNAHPYFSQLSGLRVSAHFLIRRDGVTMQFVSIDERAWHAGISTFSGRERCNDFSVGIELEGTDREAFTPIQYEALAALTRALRSRYPLSDVMGHEHIAPGRKTDPGPFFDWRRYQRLYEKSQTSRRPSASAANTLRFPEFP